MKCGWCITKHHTCKPWGFHEGTIWYCDCDCKTKEERDAIRDSDDVRSRLQEWQTQKPGLDNKRKRRSKRRIQGREPESTTATSV